MLNGWIIIERHYIMSTFDKTGDSELCVLFRETEATAGGTAQ